MNGPIVKLFGVFVVLFFILVAFSSRWAVFGATALRDNPHNSRVVLEEERVKRGIIRADDGTALARNHVLSGKRYARFYPFGRLFALPVGFNSVRFGRAGLEQYYDDQLSGRKTELADVLDSLLKKNTVGDDLETSLDVKAQRVAYQQLGGRTGAVVAMDVRTGAIRVLAGTPSYDPSDPGHGNRFNLATQGLFPPGSTFKTVTATAAIDSGKYTPNSMVSGRDHKIISGAPLSNFGGENFGDVTLTFALTHSINTVYAEVGEKIGKSTLAEYMQRFGFGSDPPMDYPANQMEPSGSYRHGHVISERSRFVDVGRTAIGQALLLATPLQMCTVAETIANGGVRMEPRLVQKVVDPDGRTVETPGPQEAERVMSSQTAASLTAMMKQVVKEGTGTAAALSGVDVAGKTGTAEIDVANGINDLWFIGFTPKDAVAVVISHEHGQGGTVAAPVAKAVLEALAG